MYIDIWVLMLNSVKLSRKNRHALSERFEKKSIIIFLFFGIPIFFSNPGYFQAHYFWYFH